MPDEELRRGMLLNSGLTNYSSVREPVLQLKVYRANQVFVKRPNAGNNLAQPHRLSRRLACWRRDPPSTKILTSLRLLALLHCSGRWCGGVCLSFQISSNGDFWRHGLSILGFA
jgi:hypothetical protein